MAKYITKENLEAFLSEIRSGKMVAGAYNDYKDEKQFGIGHGTIRLGYKYPENGYIDEIKTYSNSLKDITETPQHPGEAPSDGASQEEKDIYNNKKQQYDDYMRLKDTLKSSYSDVRLEDGRAYVKIEDVVYNTDIPDDVETLNALGDIPKNTKVKDLKGKTYAQLFNDILFPTDNNITAQGVGVGDFSINMYMSNRIVELGSDIATILNGGKLNQGSWSAYNNGLKVIGEETSRKYKMTGPNNVNIEDASLGIINEAIEGIRQYKNCGNYTYNVTIFHNAGTNNPKNNKGNYIDLGAHPTIADVMKAGYKQSSITVNVTLPCYVKKLDGELHPTLLQWSTSTMTLEHEFPPHTSNNKSEFQIPRKMTAMQIYDANSGQWKVAEDINFWVMTKEEKTFNGVKHEYYNYIYNLNNDKDSVKIKISF